MMYYRISKNEKNLFFGKKIAQVWAVTLSCLFHMLTNISIEANSVDPGQTPPIVCRSSLILVYILGKASKTFRQMTKAWLELLGLNFVLVSKLICFTHE